METHIFDIDGTIVKYHTNEWIFGAKEYLIKLFNKGNKIIFITMRDEIRDNNEIWSVKNTKKTILKELDDLNIKYEILFNVSSPRIIHDDSQIIIDQRKTDEQYGNKILSNNKYVNMFFKGQGMNYNDII